MLDESLLDGRDGLTYNDPRETNIRARGAGVGTGTGVGTVVAIGGGTGAGTGLGGRDGTGTGTRREILKWQNSCSIAIRLFTFDGSWREPFSRKRMMYLKLLGSLSMNILFVLM